MATHPSMNNTKKEILAAYEELLKKKQELRDQHPEEEKANRQKKVVVATAGSLSAESIVTGLANIKLTISDSIDKIEDALLKEFQKLEKLQEAIKYESDNLEELYGIKANADSLAVLLSINKEKKITFEKEMDEKKTAFEKSMREQKLDWEKEQRERNQQWKEEENERKKIRSREEDDYQYSKNISRKKEEDEYKTKRAAQEKELIEKKQDAEKALTEREQIIGGKEKELADLHQQVDRFPHILGKEVAQAQKQLEEKLNTQYKYEKDLYAKEMQGEIKLLQQTVASLQGKIKEQDQLISSLNEKTGMAGEQVQTIALKALDSASSFRQNLLISKEKREDKDEHK